MVRVFFISRQEDMENGELLFLLKQVVDSKIPKVCRPEIFVLWKN
jgi:hypothetical protein